MKNVIAKSLLLTLVWFIGSLAWAHGGDAKHIAAVMKKQFDRPEAPLTVNPVTVEGNYAVAGWLQGTKGGRALLQKENGHWRIIVCGGDGLTQTQALETTGMSADVAKKLAKNVLAAESKLTAAVRQQLSSFEGMLKIDAADNAHHSYAAHDNKPAH